MNDAILQQIEELSEQGNLLVEQGRLREAIEVYARAFLVPEPIDQWRESTWLLIALGETCFFAGETTRAAEYLKLAIHCPDAIGNPLIHLRLGQVQHDLGNLDRAADELTREYMAEGPEIFAAESEVPRVSAAENKAVTKDISR